MTISIIIPIFNGLKFTKSCLFSLVNEHKIENKKVKFYLIVIDDGSTDGSKEWIEENYPQVIVLTGNGNLWWSGGINKGVDYAINTLETNYVVWWNNDIIAGEEYFDNLISIAGEVESNTIVGSKIFLAQDKDTVWAMGGLFDINSGYKEMVGSEQPDNEALQNPIEVDWLPGMGTLIHRDIYNKIGMVDEKTFPQYHGDSDFTLRAKLNGFKIMVFPTLKIYNDTTNSGLKHNESFNRLFRSLFSIRSNYNISKDFKFYYRHTKSIKAYKIFLEKYIRYVGGFMKWKLLQLLGVKRP